ncbi:MAG TPA: AAA family ATPase [Anaerolineales bacterium]|nr:AAA family ATPase [Anaerolineales bacterium]
MFNVCHNCGLYRSDKVIDPAGPFAICPECGHKHPFRMLPLLLVSGASGAGKSSVCQTLLGKMENAVLLDGDIIWRAEFNTPDDNYRDYFETWLRLAKNISQSGRPVVSFGAGMGVPANIEPCIERRYFSTIHYLALICDDEVLAQRLKARPAWRGSSEEAFVDRQIQFNRWFKEKGNRYASLIDATSLTLETTAEQVQSWILEKING